jgi:hypothetical protein
MFTLDSVSLTLDDNLSLVLDHFDVGRGRCQRDVFFRCLHQLLELTLLTTPPKRAAAPRRGEIALTHVSSVEPGVVGEVAFVWDLRPSVRVSVNRTGFGDG